MTETIVAQATPPGRGGVGIVRVSGPFVAKVIAAILPGILLKPRQAFYTDFYTLSGEKIDQGIALYFKGPHSFTGEDVLELHCHGSPIVLDWLISEIMKLNVRMARPGEFTERAFLNDKIDLTQAEAIADLIDAQSRQAAKCALSSLEGVFSQKINELVDQLIHLRMYVEAAIDFPEEEIDFLSDGLVQAQVENLLRQFEQVFAQAKQGTLLQEGMTIVIAGRPNAGKSSLLNALSGTETAIVTDIEGTTRDIIRAHIQIKGVPLHIIDTAGLRETTDVVEQEGVRRAKAAMQNADRVLLMIDVRNLNELEAIKTQALKDIPPHLPVTLVVNKVDLVDHLPQGQLETIGGQYPVLVISAKHALGLDELKTHLLETIGYDRSTEGQFIARRRHLDALHKAYALVKNGFIQLAEHQAGELLAEDLRLAQTALSEITGEFRADDLLGEIFSSFCIGK